MSSLGRNRASVHDPRRGQRGIRSLAPWSPRPPIPTPTIRPDRSHTPARRMRDACQTAIPPTERAAPSQGGPPRSKEMDQLGCRSRHGPVRVLSLQVCPQATASLTVLTPLSNITLDTGSPPFTWLPLSTGCHRFCVCQKVLRNLLRQS